MPPVPPLDPPIKISKYFDNYDMFFVVILYLTDLFSLCVVDVVIF